MAAINGADFGDEFTPFLTRLGPVLIPLPPLVTARADIINGLGGNDTRPAC